MNENSTNIKERILQLAKIKGFGVEIFLESINQSYSNYKGKSKNSVPSTDVLVEITSKYPDVNINWLLTGNGEALKKFSEESVNEPIINYNTIQNKKNNIIPLYQDVASIGGVNAMIASTDPVQAPSEFIDAGDWFPGATAAIRHYGDSMNEYPSGCILALKEVHDRRLIFWGRNYCIETSEGRITKRMQRDNDNECILAYSTNTEVYPDGRLVHEPIQVPKEAIARLFQVLGYVVKEYSNGPVFISK